MYNAGFLIFFYKSELISCVKAPGKFIPERLQEIIFIQPHQAHGKTFSSYCYLYLFVYNLPSRIQRYNKLVGPALYFERNNIIIRHHNRSYIEVMWCYGRNHKTFRVGKYDRTIAA